MTKSKKKTESKPRPSAQRKYIRLADAATMISGSTDDLLHVGETGEISLATFVKDCLVHAVADFEGDGREVHDHGPDFRFSGYAFLQTNDVAELRCHGACSMTKWRMKSPDSPEYAIATREPVVVEQRHLYTLASDIQRVWKLAPTAGEEKPLKESERQNLLMTIGALAKLLAHVATGDHFGTEEKVKHTVLAGRLVDENPHVYGLGRVAVTERIKDGLHALEIGRGKAPPLDD